MEAERQAVKYRIFVFVYLYINTQNIYLYIYFLMLFFVFIEFVTTLLLFSVLFFFLPMRHTGSQLPDQGLNPHPLLCKVES